MCFSKITNSLHHCIQWKIDCKVLLTSFISYISEANWNYNLVRDSYFFFFQVLEIDLNSALSTLCLSNIISFEKQILKILIIRHGGVNSMLWSSKLTWIGYWPFSEKTEILPSATHFVWERAQMITHFSISLEKAHQKILVLNAHFAQKKWAFNIFNHSLSKGQHTEIHNKTHLA